MIGYAPMLGQVPLARPPAYRPPPYRPPLALADGPQMGQKSTIAAIGAIPLLVGTAISGGIAWFGFSVGSKEKGVVSVIGYVVGAVGALSALGGLTATAVWLLGVSLIPEPTTTPKATVPALPAPPETPRLPEMPRLPEFTGT